VADAELAEAIRGLKGLRGGPRLFRYQWNGDIYNLTGKALNGYIAAHLGEEFTAKDFRTWGGTLTAAIALAERGVAQSEADAKRAVAAVMRSVGDQLGNTPAVARACMSVRRLSSSTWTVERSKISGRVICAC
jgi:DNA topoisomerase-1